MDLETENRIASILMKEAAELRRQAEKEGVDAYLHKRNVRFRPNSRFLTATVLGVQQANRVAEVSEMWRVRNKELELNDKLKGTSRNKLNHGSTSSTSPGRREDNYSHRSSSTRRSDHDGNLATSSKAEYSHRSSSTRRSDHDGSLATSSKAEYSSSEDGSLKDEEIEQFLHSRAKRGRGGVGPRMDEPGPYLPRSGSSSKTRLSESPDVRDKEEWESRVLGPEKPPSLIRSHLSLEDDDDNWRKVKKVKVESSEKHSKKHSRKKDKHKERKSKERKSKHKHKSRRD